MRIAVRKVLTVIIGLAALIAVLVGCRGDAADGDGGSHGSSGMVGGSMMAQEGQREYIHVAQYISLPGNVSNIRNLIYHDGKLYFIATKYDMGDEVNPYIAAINTGVYSIDLDGMGFSEIISYADEAAEFMHTNQISWIAGLAVDNEGCIWLALQHGSYEFSFPADFNIDSDNPWEHTVSHEESYIVRKLDGNGAELLSAPLDITDDLSEMLGIASFAIIGNADDGGEYICLNFKAFGTSNAALYAFDGNGQLLLNHNYQSEIVQFFNLLDGSTAFTVITGEGEHTEISAYKIKTESNLFAITFDETIEISGSQLLPADADKSNFQIYGGFGEYSFCIKNRDGLYGFSESNGSITGILNWQRCGITIEDVTDIAITPDGRIVCLSNTRGGSELSDRRGAELIILTETPQSEVVQKTALTLAVLSWSREYIQAAVAEFNRISSEYIVEIVEYPDVAALTLDLTVGKPIDILHISMFLPYADYVSSGLLEDLYPYIDAHPLISRGDFVPAALQAAEMSGGLYCAFPGFYVYTVFGHPSVVGPQMGWSFEEFEGVLAANPGADIPFGVWETEDSFLMNVIRANIDMFIDREVGTAAFDTPQFVKILDISGNFPSPYLSNNGSDRAVFDTASEDEPIRTGRQIAMPGTISSMSSLSNAKAMLGGDIVFKGYPSDTNNNHELRTDDNSLGIITTSENKDGAWQFIQMVLDKDWQLANVQMFPSNQEALSIRLASEDGDMLMELINGATNTVYLDETLSEIIRDGILDYITGMNDAQETARIIQKQGEYLSIGAKLSLICYRTCHERHILRHERNDCAIHAVLSAVYYVSATSPPRYAILQLLPRRIN